MIMLLSLTILCYFIAIIYHIVTHNLEFFEWFENLGWSFLCGFIIWLAVSCLGGVIVGAVIAPDHHSQIETSTVLEETFYNIVPLHDYDAAYPEGFYIESFRENETNKYRFAYELDGALYSKTISQSSCILGYCTPNTPASIVFYDRDLPTNFMRVVFIDPICDIYNIKIPHGAIYVRPTT